MNAEKIEAEILDELKAIGDYTIEIPKEQANTKDISNDETKAVDRPQKSKVERICIFGENSPI